MNQRDHSSDQQDHHPAVGPTDSLSLADLLSIQADQLADQPAIMSSWQESLSYADLWNFVTSIVGQLRTLGISSTDRVAIVLPNGPAMAVSFLAVSCGATAAPLNPNYREKEFDFYLEDLDARAVIVPKGSDSDVVDVAKKRAVTILELEISDHHRAGEFDLASSDSAIPSNAMDSDVEFSNASDVALVLHTSGTTSRPKMVPLTNRNVRRSAYNIAESLTLTESDRCLNVMPLFHIHGLIGAVLASIHAGASIVCTPGFDVARFYEDMSKMSPTWYTAVPTMHQALLAAADDYSGVIADHRLRFIRSCSSALPPAVLAKIMEEFGVPVIEAYGMTEAAHQMTCNPFPPLPCKPGSVGLPTGVEVAIMDPAGNIAPAGTTGEVVIRGDNVTLGYTNNSEANAEAFKDGWFRTGDQGHFDQDGYLFLTGRLKEMINRGGENISPREIDDVLLEHPQIAQAITFAVPHPTLGESVAAAIVSASETPPSEQEVREFVSSRVSEFKVPQKILLLDEIPKGPTGKPQRIGLADKLGLTRTIPARPNVDITTPTEKRLQAVWQEVLSREVPIGREGNFFDLGGDSLRAVQLLNRVRSEMGIEIDIAEIFEGPTLGELAAVIDRSVPRQELKAG